MVSTTLAIVLLTISLSNDGHWLAEREGTVQIHWTMPEHAMGAALHWQLSAGGAELATGRVQLPADEPTTELTLVAPTVRVRTALQWRYTLRAVDDDRRLAHGEHTLHVYPDTQLAGVADRLAAPVMVLAEAGAPLVTVLQEAGVAHQQVDHASSLQLAQPQFVLVAADRLIDAAGEAEALRQLARAGTSVMIFEHRNTDRLMGFRLRRRPAPPPGRLRWREDHALLHGFDATDRQSWLASRRDVWAIELPVDESALELTWWPSEAEVVEPAPVDALVLTQTVGRGRVVLWQMPLGPWETDPRSQRLLSDALDYLGTRPGPTPALADRPPRKPVKATEGQDATDQLLRKRAPQ